MLVRQAIVSSPGSRALKDNELISSSDGVSKDLARALCQWSPGLNGLGFGQTQGTSVFQPDANTFALSRSVRGTGNGSDEGRRVTSKLLLFSPDQFTGYHNNIAALFHVLQSAGLMILQSSYPDKLPMLNIPERAFEPLAEFERSEFSGENERVDHAVALHKRVVVLGLKNSLSFMCSFLAAIPESKRVDFSFATGLKVDDETRFSLQFFPDSEPELVKELASRQIRTISIESKTTVLS